MRKNNNPSIALSGQIAFALNEGERYKIQLKIKRYFLFIFSLKINLRDL